MNTGVFYIYKLLENSIEKNNKKIKDCLINEFKDIQHLKTTSLNKNYMFNDQISNQFYNIIGITKENLKSLINKYVTITKNYDSLDANNMLLLFLMRYFLKNNNESSAKIAYEIFLYKNFYPIFTKYFKYGVDESAFEYFKTTLSSKYELSKQENLYATVDVIGKRNYDKYKKFIYGNSEKDFLLIPVNTKNRLNQFTKELMRAYKPFIEKNKVHLNASRDLEDEEGGIFNDQTYNNNKINLEYKNRFILSVMHDEIPEVMLNKIAQSNSKSDENDVKNIYKNIIKNKEVSNEISDILIDNRDSNFKIEDKRSLNKWLTDASKHKPDDYIEKLDKIIIENINYFKDLNKTSLIEKRKILIILFYIMILKNLNK